MQTLLRKPVEQSVFDQAIDEHQENLAERACNELNYSYLKYRLRKNEKDTEFLQTLIDLNIQPFDIDTVEQYKKETAKWLNKKLKRKDWLHVLHHVSPILFKMAIFTATISGICLITKTHPITMCFLFFLSVISVVVSSWTVIIGLSPAFARWDKCKLNDYREPIPEFALETALNLNEKIPHVDLYISYLTTEAETFDPFLIAEDRKGNSYYLEVWDEPDFKAKKLI